MKWIAGFILQIWGWKIVANFPSDMKKCVMVMAPHTSMWDFVIGRLGYYKLGLKAKFLIKKEMFVFPLGPILNWLGAIPVDRGKSAKMVDYIAGLFDQYDSIFFTITPEGTRSLNHRWKKGFYYISLRAGVPVALGFLDYKKKIGGIGKVFTPTGNFDEDFKMIEDFYRGVSARHPEKFNLS